MHKKKKFGINLWFGKSFAGVDTDSIQYPYTMKKWKILGDPDKSQMQSGSQIPDKQESMQLINGKYSMNWLVQEEALREIQIIRANDRRLQTSDMQVTQSIFFESLWECWMVLVLDGRR